MKTKTLLWMFAMIILVGNVVALCGPSGNDVNSDAAVKNAANAKAALDAADCGVEANKATANCLNLQNEKTRADQQVYIGNYKDICTNPQGTATKAQCDILLVTMRVIAGASSDVDANAVIAQLQAKASGKIYDANDPNNLVIDPTNIPLNTKVFVDGQYYAYVNEGGKNVFVECTAFSTTDKNNQCPPASWGKARYTYKSLLYPAEIRQLDEDIATARAGNNGVNPDTDEFKKLLGDRRGYTAQVYRDNNCGDAANKDKPICARAIADINGMQKTLHPDCFDATTGAFVEVNEGCSRQEFVTTLAAAVSETETGVENLPIVAVAPELTNEAKDALLDAVLPGLITSDNFNKDGSLNEDALIRSINTYCDSIAEGTTPGSLTNELDCLPEGVVSLAKRAQSTDYILSDTPVFDEDRKANLAVDLFNKKYKPAEPVAGATPLTDEEKVEKQKQINADALLAKKYFLSDFKQEDGTYKATIRGIESKPLDLEKDFTKLSKDNKPVIKCVDSVGDCEYVSSKDIFTIQPNGGRGRRLSIVGEETKEQRDARINALSGFEKLTAQLKVPKTNVCLYKGKETLARDDKGAVTKQTKNPTYSADCVLADDGLTPICDPKDNCITKNEISFDGA
ncbi:MAG: hypothetical protein Q8O89_08505, partial [Nanoarchaeota archaeon]|nr:hypothetical protein [Nanoarchaeota archaeon]